MWKCSVIWTLCIHLFIYLLIEAFFFPPFLLPTTDRTDDSDAVPHPSLLRCIHDAVGLAFCLPGLSRPLGDHCRTTVPLEKVGVLLFTQLLVLVHLPVHFFLFFFILITSRVIAIHACQYWYWLLYRIWLSLSLLFLLRYYVWRCTKLRWLNTLNKIYANQKSVGMIWKWQPFQREETRLCECAQGTAVSACVDSTAPLIVITTKTVCAPAPVHGAFSSCSEKLGIHY